MQLNDTQKTSLKKWIDEECGLSEIQRRLASEFNIAMTYMDVRFLLIDLGLELKDARKSPPVNTNLKTTPPSPTSPAPGADGSEDEEESPDAFQDAPQPPPGLGGNVTIDIDRLMRPGALVSGTVTFSDGVTAKWALDQAGRLALDAGRPNYRPSQADVQSFQTILTQKLQQRGF